MNVCCKHGKLYLCFLVFGLISHLSLAISDNELNEIKSGLKFADSLITSTQQYLFPTFMTGAASAAIGFISGTLKFVGFILSFLGTNESQELLAIKRLYTQMDKRFDAVDIQLSAIQKQIDWSRLKLQFGDLERNIKSDSIYLKSIYQSPIASKESETDFFIHAWESNCWVCALNLYHGIMGSDVGFSDDILQVAMTTFEHNRPLTQTFMTGLFKLLVLSVTNELAYRSIKYPKASYLYQEYIWKQRLHNITSRMMKFDETIKNKYHEQAEKDILNFAKANPTSSLTNEHFSKRLYDFLVQKFYWRDWLVIVYKPIRGDAYHNNNVCDGYRKYRTYGRNIVVSSVIQSKIPINTTEAAFIINSMTTTYQTCSDAPCTHNYNCISVCKSHYYNSMNLFSTLPKDCAVYASAGVIDSWVDLWYQGLPKRLVQKRTPGSNSYSIHLFG